MRRDRKTVGGDRQEKYREKKKRKEGTMHMMKAQAIRERQREGEGVKIKVSAGRNVRKYIGRKIGSRRGGKGGKMMDGEGKGGWMDGRRAEERTGKAEGEKRYGTETCAR